MAVVGVDFGNLTCYISVARAGGIESIANDYSMRDTPSMVGFSGRQRIIGVGAKNQLLTNLKKTVFNFKHLLGRSFRDKIVQENLAGLPFDVVEGDRGEVRVNVDYMDAKRSYTPEEVTAMLFTKLKETAEEALSTKVKDIVISCPAYFADSERRALLDAAAIAGLNVLKLMNDTTATALAYGIYKQDLPAPEEKARNVVFVDCGHVGVQAAACSFHKGKLVMKACTFDRNCAGASFDRALVRYFSDDFKAKTRLDAFSKPRALVKLASEVEKVKKQMSANTNKLPLNIECFMEERDLTGSVDRTTFEGLISDQLGRIEKVLAECLELSAWKPDDIYAVEVVGGSSRIPAVKAAIERVFAKTPQTTLNADEAVSRGCALQCAILSPTFRVREFSVTDIQPYAVKLTWKAESDTGDMVVFPKFHQVPFSKILTFYRRDNFSVDALYDGDVPVANPHIGNFEIGEVKPAAEGANQKVKVKVRINLHGVFVVSSANFVEKHEVEEEVQMEVDSPQEDAGGTAASSPDKAGKASEAQDEGAKEGEPAKEAADAEMKDASDGKREVRTEKRKKVVSKTVDLPVTSRVNGTLSRDKLESAANQERDLAAQDRYESERLTAKNAVEEYIYAIRDKLADELADYVVADEADAFRSTLSATEDWLYEDGEECEKSVYEAKLKDLKMVGEAAKKRRSEYAGRRDAIDSLGRALQLATKAVDLFKAGDPKYDHLAEADVEKVAKLAEEKSAWLNGAVATLDKTGRTTNPTILVCQFYSEKEAFEKVALPILNKAKPKVEPPPAPASAGKKAPPEEAKKDDKMEEGANNVNGDDSQQQQQTMDLD